MLGIACAFSATRVTTSLLLLSESFSNTSGLASGCEASRCLAWVKALALTVFELVVVSKFFSLSYILVLPFPEALTGGELESSF